MDQETVSTCEGEGNCQCAETCTCETQTKEQRSAEPEEMQLAFLLALMPLVVLTFFGQVGLI